MTGIFLGIFSRYLSISVIWIRMAPGSLTSDSPHSFELLTSSKTISLPLSIISLTSTARISKGVIVASYKLALTIYGSYRYCLAHPYDKFASHPGQDGAPMVSRASTPFRKTHSKYMVAGDADRNMTERLFFYNVPG